MESVSSLTIKPLDLLVYKAKLERTLTKESIESLGEINQVVQEILSVKKTNQEWLSIISNIIEERKQNYQLKLVKGIRNGIKWNAILLVDEGFNLESLAKDEESGIIFFAPDLYCEYYKDENFVLFGAFYGEKESYFNEQRTLIKILRNGIGDSLRKEELDKLYELIFKEYEKIRKRSSYVKTRRM